MSAIREDDLRRDLFALAGDALKGRRAGTIDELRAAVWVADQARKAGLRPAGEDGSYFQFFHLRRTQVSAASQLLLDHAPLTLWKDSWVTAPVQARVEGLVTWLPALADTARNLQGRIVAMPLLPPTPLPAAGVSLWGYRYVLSAVRQQGNSLRAAGAAALILVADAETEKALSFVGNVFREGTYQLDGAAAAAGRPAMPVILVRAALRNSLRDSVPFRADIMVDHYAYPSVNVVAKAPGTDARLKEDYVLFSGHHDHDGVGTPTGGDSIWNGADDNATVSVALLAIGRAWVRQPGKRSALFVWHGAEERGLFGSRWFAEHPTVPKASIVAVLNGDMIGRNHPDSAALLGVVPPHRNSAELAAMAWKANEQTGRFKVDTTWDNPRHPEGWYFRSDHLPYARAGIPALFFTTLLHADYHTPDDDPESIDLAKLVRMTRWMYATGWLISATGQRPLLDAAQ